ncbi:MAG: hypothetical protein KJ749_01050 [Planctomycetes bacterium]|nr:hypothetical protein [Planctomycetota bacterium]
MACGFHPTLIVTYVLVEITSVGAGCAARQGAQVLLEHSDPPAAIVYDAVVLGALRREQWSKEEAEQVLESYRIAERLLPRLPAERIGAEESFLSARIAATKAWIKRREHSKSSVSAPGGEMGFRQCPVAAFEVYNALIRKALRAQFIDGDSARAVELYQTCLAFMENMPPSIRASEILPELCRRREATYYHVLREGVTKKWHTERLQSLLSRAQGKTVSSGASLRQAVPPGPTRKDAPVRLTVRSGADPYYGPVYSAVLDQALLADYWFDEAVNAVCLYRTALRLARLGKHIDHSERLSERLSILREPDEMTPDADENESVVFRFWMGSGYIAGYLAILDAALYAEYRERDYHSALLLYSAAREMADGFDGSTALFEADMLRDRMEAVSKAVSVYP